MAQLAPLLALIAGLVSLLGLLSAQFRILAPMSGFILFAAGSVLGGGLSVLAGSIGLFLSRGGQNPDGFKLSLAGIIAGAGLLGLVAVAASPGRGRPAINDITTNLDDPPSYAGRDLPYPPEFVPQVRAAYADLQPLILDEPPAQVYNAALALAERRGWKVTMRSDANFTFEAEDETGLFRFVDDVTLRIAPFGARSKVDMRSKSRDGRGDLGTNAARIRAFLLELEDSLSV